MKKEEEYFSYVKISNHQIDVSKQKLINLIKSKNIPNFNSYSIVGDVSKDKIIEILSSMNNKKSRVLGCFMGMVVGYKYIFVQSTSSL